MKLDSLVVVGHSTLKKQVNNKQFKGSHPGAQGQGSSGTSMAMVSLVVTLSRITDFHILVIHALI